MTIKRYITVINNVAYINGVKILSVMSLFGADLRSSAALIIAALTSNRISYIYGLEHLDRGYENFELKLSKLGAQIEREITNKILSEREYKSSNLNLEEIPDIKAA